MKTSEKSDILKNEIPAKGRKPEKVITELSEEEVAKVSGGFDTGEVVVTSYSFSVGDWFEDQVVSFIVTENVTDVLGHVLVRGIEFRTSRGPGIDQHPASYTAERIAGWTYNGPYPGDYSPIDYDNPAQYH